MEKVRADLKNGISPSSTVPRVVINRPHVINGPCVIDESLTINGDLVINGDCVFKVSIVINGNCTMNGNCTFKGPLSCHVLSINGDYNLTLG